MLIRLLLLSVLLLPASMVKAQIDDWASLQDEIQMALRSSSLESLMQIRTRLESEDSDQPAWTAYWQAYISFLLVNLVTDESEQTGQVQACKSSSETAIELGEDSGESHALLASCLGRLAAGGMMAGMRYGTEAGNVQDESILIAPDNPRVLMLAAVSDYNTPVMWGGDIDRAERRLRRALAILNAASPIPDPIAPWQPTWGLHDAYGHFAIVLNRLAQTEEASSILDQARERGIRSPWLQSIRASLQSAD